MDPIWKTLPTDLVHRVCNQLPNVRRIPVDLKREIESRIRIVRDVEYPLSSTGLMRGYNSLQVPTEGVQYRFSQDGFVRDMCARVVEAEDGWWLWYPLGMSYSSYWTRTESPIRVRF